MSDAPDTPKRDFKYNIENAVTMSCDWAGILAPAQLEAVATNPEVPVCNIYLIGRRPRVTVDPNSWVCDAQMFEVSVMADLGDGESVTVALSGPNPFGFPLVLVSKSPYTVMELHDEAGRLVTGATTAMWFSMYLQTTMGLDRMNATLLDVELFDLDVVYVGQSQDEGGALASRLQNHKTLQRVMADTHQNAPHLDVWVVPMQFATYNKMSSFGSWSGSEGDEQSLTHMSAFEDAALDVSVVTALAEAAMIRYFQPEFNEKFIDTFPEPLHKTYRQVYDLDLNSVGIDFETLTTVGIRLKSRVVEPTFIHAGLFAMHDEAERRRFFDLGDVGGLAEVTHFKRGPASDIP
ncbi:hypothetical protein [Rhodococcoides yunnanense]|uniref:Uncharacterized protein n=1 Tax=Rhodococcoides yunnanense TaxID=278209 RepID=A0ABU4BIB7_9NOCA|nr:hypothetical protein [Rhodococcus yunnanensis]MDV6263952.1 hypothetical protein [Rhodococcus yunnanensis]